MTLRRYTPLKPSRGTQIPPSVRAYVYARDGGRCVMARLVNDHRCIGGIEIDHVRASGGLGMKSPSVAANLLCLCAEAHRYKTEHGREIRPLLIDYLEKVEGPLT